MNRQLGYTSPAEFLLINIRSSIGSCMAARRAGAAADHQDSVGSRRRHAHWTTTVQPFSQHELGAFAPAPSSDVGCELAPGSAPRRDLGTERLLCLALLVNVNNVLVFSNPVPSYHWARSVG